MTTPQHTVRPARAEFLTFAPPQVGEAELAAVSEVLRSGWITTGPRTRGFENSFREYFGAPGALALNSCTAALHVALVTAGVGPGDEVITTPITFAASVNVIEHVGATPVLVDVERDTLNIDPGLVEAAITPRTKAMIPVHFAGHPVELDAVTELAAAHGILLLEDAAHALPARYRGRMIGSGTNPVAFSFYATKNLTSAEGGMLTATPEFLDRARVVSLHGLSRDAWKRYDRTGSWRYDVQLPGFKYNMTDIQAAIGEVQLGRLESFQERRRQIVARYSAAFGAEPALEPPTVRDHVDHAWHLYVLRLRLDALRIGRDQFVEALGQRNIGTSVHFIPIHHHSFYRERFAEAWGPLPVADAEFERLFSLPLYPGLSDSDVDDVIAAVLETVEVNRR